MNINFLTEYLEETEFKIKEKRKLLSDCGGLYVLYLYITTHHDCVVRTAACESFAHALNNDVEINLILPQKVAQENDVK